MRVYDVSYNKLVNHIVYTPVWLCFYTGSTLDRKKKVRDYNFLGNETIVFIQRNHGGVGGFNPPSGVKLEMTEEQCCALYNDNPDELRARMPCKCAISNLSFSDLILIYDYFIYDIYSLGQLTSHTLN